MKTRAAVLALSLLVPAGAGVAAAAPKPKPVKPVCNLVTDPAGDAEVNGAALSEGDDTIGGDIASDGVTLTGVIRMAGLAANDPQWLNGRSYLLEFAAPGVAEPLFLQARAYPTGTVFSFGYSGVDPVLPINTSYSLGAATGVVDLEKKEVRISAPVKAYADAGKAGIKKGAKLSGLVTRVYRQGGQGLVPSQQVGPARVPLSGLNLLTDEGFGTSYVVGTPSCVALGK